MTPASSRAARWTILTNCKTALGTTAFGEVLLPKNKGHLHHQYRLRPCLKIKSSRNLMCRATSKIRCVIQEVRWNFRIFVVTTKTTFSHAFGHFIWTNPGFGQTIASERKRRLTQELEKEAIDSKLSRLLKTFKTKDLDMKTITEEVESVRQDIYDGQKD